ncbi:MAG: hypothetical protein L6R38_007429 [Xanthoria sp. 2 TBL-2021]|nr:MAG: hypothetical protein L6R38_007429 [Xanthoria sp. 2 TBL-2021]
MTASFERLEYRLRAALHSLTHPTFTPSVRLTLPPLSLLKLLPIPSEPKALPPPTADTSFATPFNISSEVYNNALSGWVPTVIATVYVIGALYWNTLNNRRDHKPWSFSKTRTFYLLVLIHNSLLAAYSAWTFFGLLNAFNNTWPGWEGEHKIPRIVDSLCKIHGPRGYGSAASYNSNKGVWGFTDRTMKLDQDLPDTTDVGRLWNEGLAFYGWLFYLSKYYELLDSALILTKGKSTTRMQIFHHAGAMLSTWAGIRYMSPPIWMFVFINSGIHSFMYTYYTLKHMNIHLPRLLKSALTAAQITQIVFGVSYAMAHLFIAYDIPVEIPYLFIHNLLSALPNAASSVSSAVVSATASADIGSWLKKAALRAAGEEGLAENVRNAQGQTFGIDAVHAAEVEKAQEEIRYKSQYQRVNCLDTSGQTFAILLNVVYLTPLACMFIQFFYTNYIKQARSSSPPTTSENVRRSGKEAAKDLRQELEDAMSSEQDGLETDKSDIPSQIADQAEKFNKGAENFSKKAKSAASNATDRVKDGAHQANDIFQEKGQQATDAISDKVNELNKKAKDSKDRTSQQTETHDTGATKDVKNEPEESSKSSKDDAPKQDMDKAPKLEPTSSSNDSAKKPKSRSVSPQKKTQLPRPQSRNRQQSPGRKDQGPKDEDKASKEQNKAQTNGAAPSKGDSKGGRKDDAGGDEEKPSSLDESAYEVNPDELENEEEKKAEAKMQPKLS